MRRLARYTAVFVITLFAVYLLWFFRAIIAMFVASLALAALFRPIFHRLHQRGIARGLALAITYAALLLPLAIVGWWLIPALLEESQALVSFFAVKYETSWDNKEQFPEWQTALLNMLPNPDVFYVSLTGTGDQPPPEALVNTVRTMGTLLGSLPLIVMLSIYWASGQEQFERLWLSLLPVLRRQRARNLWREIETALGVYLRSELFQVVTSFVVLAFCLMAIDYPYPILLSLISALLMPLPLFGSPLAVAAVILGTVFQKASTTVMAASLTAATHLFFFIVVEPRLMGRWRYNPLLALFIIILLVESLGFVGLFIAPPLAALIQITLRTLFLQQAFQSSSTSIEELRSRVGTVISTGFGSNVPAEFESIVDRLNGLIAQTQQTVESRER